MFEVIGYWLMIVVPIAALFVLDWLFPGRR